jgi:hypothetical protein
MHLLLFTLYGPNVHMCCFEADYTTCMRIHRARNCFPVYFMKYYYIIKCQIKVMYLNKIYILCTVQIFLQSVTFRKLMMVI